MYKYDDRTADMYKTPNPRFNDKPIREHLRWIDIHWLGDREQRMTVKAQGINGKEFTFATNGRMTIQEIIDTLVKGLKL